MNELPLAVVIVAAVIMAVRTAPDAVRICVPYLSNAVAVASGLMRWWLVRPGRVVQLTAGGAALALATSINIYLFVITDDLPDISPIIEFRPEQIGYFRDTDGEVVMRLATSYRDPVTFDELPAVVREAIIAAEDKRFYSPLHPGVDPLAWPRVAWMNAWGIKRQGGSTLTQQLARTIYPEIMEGERSSDLSVNNMFTRQIASLAGTQSTNTIIRKGVEIKDALFIERALTDHFERLEPVLDDADRDSGGPRLRARQKAKEHILTCYANLVYLGNGVYGFSYASRFYFGKRLDQLKPEEAALLASFIPFPGPYADLQADEAGMAAKRDRRNVVLRRMARNGFLDSDQLRSALDEPVAFTPRDPRSKTIAPAAINMALHEVKVLGVPHRLITSGFAHPDMTVDLDIQLAVNKAVDAGRENFGKLWPRAEIPQMAVVVLRNRDAAVLGMFGGMYDDSLNTYTWYNRAVQAVRQPGSGVKGIVILAAVREGYGPSDTFMDAPLSLYLGRDRYGRARYHWPRNFDGEFTMQPMSVREILARSQNIPTLRLAQAVGIRKIISTARMLGIRSHLDPYLTTALGANGVTPLEFTNAYRAIASGISAEPYVVRRITDEKGLVIVERTVITEPLPVPAEQLDTVRELLRGTIRLPNGTGRSLDSSSFGIPIAGKTGTSNDCKDAWFVGFTYGADGITVLAWVGYDEFSRPMQCEDPPRATGATVALPIVREIFRSVYGENTPLGHPPRFPRQLEQNIDDYLVATYPERYGPK